MRLIVRTNDPYAGSLNHKNLKFYVDGDAGPFRVTSQADSTSWQVGSNHGVGLTATFAEPVLLNRLAHTPYADSNRFTFVRLIFSDGSNIEMELEKGASSHKFSPVRTTHVQIQFLGNTGSNPGVKEFAFFPPRGSKSVGVEAWIKSSSIVRGWAETSGLVKFWWWPGGDSEWSASVSDVLGLPFGSCKRTDSYCFQRLPSSFDMDCTELVVEQGNILRYKWVFSSENVVSAAVWQALVNGKETIAGILKVLTYE